MFARQDANVPFEAWVTIKQVDLTHTFSDDMDTCFTYEINDKENIVCLPFSLHGCVQRMSAGDLEFKQVAYDAFGAIIFTASGQTHLSLAFMQSIRIIVGCVGVNLIIALLSTIALLAVMCRQFELFSAISLLLFTGTSIFVTFFQQATAKDLVQYEINNDAGIRISKDLQTSIYVQIFSIPLYATIHNFFAL